MTKLWFKTKNDQIVDLNQYCRISIILIEYREKKPYVVEGFMGEHVESESLTFNMFDTKEEAQQYLDEIYQLLIDHKVEYAKSIQHARENLEKLLAEQNVLFRCDECKKYPPLEALK